MKKKMEIIILVDKYKGKGKGLWSYIMSENLSSDFYNYPLFT